MINEYVIEYGWCEDEPGPGYRMYAKLSKKFTKRLKGEVSGNAKFVHATSLLIAYASIHSCRYTPAKMRAIKKECAKIRNALDNISLDAHNVLVNQYIWEFMDRDPTFQFKDDESGKLLTESVDILHEALKTISHLSQGEGGTLRQDIGRRAKAIFDKFNSDTENFKTTTSETGKFVNYLCLISEASGFDFNAHKLARNILKD